MLRGDDTIDRIVDSGTGTNDKDTLSFAGGVTPGFIDALGRPGDPNDYTNFPGEGGERGVYIDLGNKIADNGSARDGGGRDDWDYLTGLENAIGTPYADYIVGDSGANVIDGGGGPDVILGAGGNDTLYGNAGHDNVTGGDGADYTDGGPGKDFCEGEGESSCDETGTSSDAVIARDDAKVQVGLIARPGITHKDFYLTGSDATDNVEVTFNPGNPDTVQFKLTSADFDVSEAEKTDNCNYSDANATPKRVVCWSYSRIGTIIVAGLDDLFGPYTGMPRATTYISLGGDGNDWIKGTNTSDDLLVDGDGRDRLHGFAKDDGLINNAGVDELWLGYGNDLAISASLCDNAVIDGKLTGDEIHGGLNSDNASWAQLPDSFNGVAARLADGEFGYRPSNGPTCAGHGGKLGELSLVENLEGSKMVDGLFGGGNNNILLGRPGDDYLSAGAGNDFINARNRDTQDPPRWSDDDTIWCGADVDQGRIDPRPLDEDLFGYGGNLKRG